MSFLYPNRYFSDDKIGSDNDQMHINICIFIILILGFVQRTILFITYKKELNAFISTYPDWVFVYLSTSGLEDMLCKSLLYLQQSPPIPNIMFGIAIKLFGWPYGAAYTCIILQNIMSLISAVIMFRILCFICRRTYVNCIVVLIFLLSTDIISIEFNHFGQNLYESISMTLILLIIYSFIKLSRTNQLRFTVIIGLFTAGLALSRASYSYFGVIPLIFLMLLNLPAKKLHLACFCAVILIFHGGWTIKNSIIYNTFSIATTTFKGGNFQLGLVKAGLEEDMIELIMNEKKLYPPWFIALTEDNGMDILFPPRYKPYIPENIKKKDNKIQAVLKGTNPLGNTIAIRVLSDQYMSAYIRFLLKNPKMIVIRFLKSYLVFWEPIRNYAAIQMNLLYIKPVIKNSFRIDLTIKHLIDKKLPEVQYVATRGDYIKKKEKQINLLSISILPIIALTFNILAIHILSPFFICCWLINFKKSITKQIVRLDYIFMAAIFMYAVLVYNICEYGENMRYRFSVEPVIWIMSVYSGVCLTRLLQTRKWLFFPVSAANREKQWIKFCCHLVCKNKIVNWFLSKTQKEN